MYLYLDFPNSQHFLALQKAAINYRLLSLRRIDLVPQLRGADRAHAGPSSPRPSSPNYIEDMKIDNSTITVG